MDKSLIVISDDEDECEDLGDLHDFNFEKALKEDFDDPFSTLNFLNQSPSQKSRYEKEEEEEEEDNFIQENKTVEIIDSSQEKKEEEEENEDERVEDLGNLEDYFQNHPSNEIDNNNDNQSYSEASSNKSNTRIPDYSLLTKKELQISIARYGFKNLKSREAMISILKNIQASENLQAPKTTSTANNKEEERMIIQHIKSQEAIWKKILRYETVHVDDVYNGLKCKKSSVKAVLDQFAALRKRHPRLDTDAI